MSSRRTDESIDVRVAADDAVEDDVVGHLELFGHVDEVAGPPLDPVVEPLLREQFARGRIVGRRELDVGGSGGAGLQQLDLDRTDPAADLEHGLVGNSAARELGDNPPRGLVESLAAVAPRVLARLLLVEELAVGGG